MKLTRSRQSNFGANGDTFTNAAKPLIQSKPTLQPKPASKLAWALPLTGTQDAKTQP